MSPPDDRYRKPGRGDGVAHPEAASLARSAELVDALLQRALRQERVLEALDLRAARSARQLATALRGATSRWASATDHDARADAAFELLELMDAAEGVLLFGGPAMPPSVPPQSIPTESGVKPKRGQASTEADPFDESGIRGVHHDDGAVEVPSSAEASPKSDQSFWQNMLGTTRGRRR